MDKYGITVSFQIQKKDREKGFNCEVGSEIINRHSNLLQYLNVEPCFRFFKKCPMLQFEHTTTGMCECRLGVYPIGMNFRKVSLLPRCTEHCIFLKLFLMYLQNLILSRSIPLYSMMSDGRACSSEVGKLRRFLDKLQG